MSQQNQPGATWQATWINLINIANSEYLLGNYQQSWKTLGLLYSWLPKLCKSDVSKQLEEINTQLQKASIGKSYNYRDALIKSQSQVSSYLESVIPKFSATIQNSLEERGWIHKEGGYGGVDANKDLEEL